MVANLTRATMLALTFLGATLTLGGCASGVKIGPWQLVEPRPPLEATRLEICRWKATATTASPSTQPAATQAGRPDEQRLVIDLTTGRAAFTDIDGKTYPQQLEQETVDKIRAYIAGRTWQDVKIAPAAGAAEPKLYSLTAFVGDAQVGPDGFWTSPLKSTGGMFDKDKESRGQGRWADPPAKPLPEGVLQIGDVFDHAVRIAHPLSDRVNLIE